jgi:hypothetical protein
MQQAKVAIQDLTHYLVMVAATAVAMITMVSQAVQVAAQQTTQE